MKKIGFIGAFEKTDLIVYVAKIIRETSKKVLVVDSTVLGRARYIVPAISPSKFYVTEFEGVDVAVGFNSLEDIGDYLGIQTLDYDVALIDIDTPENFKNFKMEYSDRNYFVTAFDNYSLKRGLEIIGKLEEKVIMTKVMFSRDMFQEEEDYLNFLSFYYSIQWDNQKIYFPYEQGDNTVIIENQRAAKIRFKDLSQDYKEGLEFIAQQIIPETKANDIKRIIKNI